MDAQPVSPQDTEWEIDHPAYRVYFHDAHHTSYEYRLTGADVDEVLAWAEANAAGRTYVAYVEVSASKGLVRLLGQDPNAHHLQDDPP
jgi:hypothetical protein